MNFEVPGRRKTAPKATRKKQVKALIRDIGLKEGAPYRKKWLL